MTPVVARTIADLCAARRMLGAPVTLVPTMGALHEGHRALLSHARQLSQPGGNVVVSIFVNPLQFGLGEDFERYPRTLEADLALCGEEGAAIVFCPDTSDIYPKAQLITVDPGPVGAVFEGSSRPGFFAGVLTVILKLFELVRPQITVFGEKDAQQLALVRRMIEDLNLGIEIVGVPTVRDADGLASSSRNAYLSPAERATALALFGALQAGFAVRQTGPAAVLTAARRVLAEAQRAEPPLVPDYLELVGPDTFAPVPSGFAGEALLLVAGTVGGTRLIDNIPLYVGGMRGEPSGRGAETLRHDPGDADPYRRIRGDSS